MEVFYITVLLSHNTYYGSFYMLVMFGKNRKGFEKMCQSTSVYQNMPVKILSGNLGRKFLIVMYRAGGKWQLIIWWNLYFGQKWLLFQTSFQ